MGDLIGGGGVGWVGFFVIVIDLSLTCHCFVPFIIPSDTLSTSLAIFPTTTSHPHPPHPHPSFSPPFTPIPSSIWSPGPPLQAVRAHAGRAPIPHSPLTPFLPPSLWSSWSTPTGGQSSCRPRPHLHRARREGGRGGGGRLRASDPRFGPHLRLSRHGHRPHATFP